MMPTMSLPGMPLAMPKNDNLVHFKFEPFLRSEYGLSVNPDRPACQFYSATGACPNGKMCDNKHVSRMFNNKIVCKHWLRGLCKKGDDCEFLHEYNLRKMPECLFYTKNGFCTQTPECLYLHIDPQSKIPHCPNYDVGFCPKGPACDKRHTRKVMCPLFLTGFCPKGPACELGHPKHELFMESLRIKPDEELVKEKEMRVQQEQKDEDAKAELERKLAQSNEKNRLAAMMAMRG